VASATLVIIPKLAAYNQPLLIPALLFYWLTVRRPGKRVSSHVPWQKHPRVLVLAVDESSHALVVFTADPSVTASASSGSPGVHLARSASGNDGSSGGHDVDVFFSQMRSVELHLPICLFHQSLPHGVNEIGIGRSESCGTHICGNLAAMIGRMHDHVQQDILLLAAEAFTLRVLVS
jgi:hypothetical protein